MPANIPRNENNFSSAYLREQGRATIETDYAAAKQYFYAAVSVDPFNGNNHASLALLCLEMDDVSAAIRWLNDGLFIDPDNEALKSLYETMKGVKKKKKKQCLLCWLSF
jgi:tetratricopeptide (TPR) repeat protein